MHPRPNYRWKRLWLGAILLSFIGWVWLDSRNGGGVADYRELLLWRNPWKKDPHPKSPTLEEPRQAAADAQETAPIEFDERKWAEDARFLEGSEVESAVNEQEQAYERKRIEDFKKALEEIQKLPSVEGFPSTDSMDQTSRADVPTKVEAVPAS